MFRWCSYCQKYMGETDPRDSFELTHGVCERCRPQAISNDIDLVAKARPLVNFFNSLKTDILAKNHRDASTLLESSILQGIAPVDLLVGIMQPLLYEIAKLQAAGKVTIRQEHEFSLLVDQVLREIEKTRPNHNSHLRPGQCDVLLACANGNYHVFGVRIIHEFLKNEGISSMCFYPSLPLAEILESAEDCSAKVVGISAATEDQVLNIQREWKALVEDRSKKPRVNLILGGQGVSLKMPSTDSLFIHKGGLGELKALIDLLISKT